MPAFSIGSITFPTKKAATAEVRRILHESALDEVIPAPASELIAALYAQHPRKDGEPVAFMVCEHSYHGTYTRGFYAVMPHGPAAAFSYIPCINPTADKPSLGNAMRAAIMLSQREALRAAYQGKAFITCHMANCTTAVALPDAHVHHLTPKFRDILDAFVGLIGYPEVKNSELLGDDFASQQIKKRWIMFHDAVAQRVVVCAKCNAEDERSAVQG